MSQTISNAEGREASSLNKQKGKLGAGTSNEKSYKELSKRNMNVDSSQVGQSNPLEDETSPQKLSFLEELASREEEIRRILHESKPTKTKEPAQEKSAKKNVYAEIIKPDSDDEECTFKPKINAKTNKLVKRPNTDQPVNEMLYKSALDKKAKGKEAEAEAKQNALKIANSNKISVNSMKIVFKRIETALRNLIQEVEEFDQKDHLSFENLGLLLHRLGLFKNLEFSQGEEASHRSSVSINQSKVKPQMLAREIAFHENLWRILVTASNNENFISSEIIFRFLMVLLEDKVSVHESASFLQEIMNIGLEEKGVTKDNEESAFEKVRAQNNLWDLEKLVSEFRKLFTDKTTFMNIYSNAAVLPSRSVMEDKKQTNFKPQINQKSKDLDMKSKYKEQVQSVSSARKLENRFDILFEHHKYVKEKKNEELETKLEQELANCTFRPQITEYKKKERDNVQSPNNPYADLDIPNAKRHDLLYEVAKVQKEKLNQKVHEAKKQEEIKELSECTFAPRIHPGHEEYSMRDQAPNSGPIKGYSKAVQRMKIAERIREEKRLEKEYVPRGENYEKMRHTDFKPPSFLNRQKTQKNEPLVYVDVNIGTGKTGRIGIHRGDDAKTLARNFARTYSLPAVMKESLEKLLQQYIDSYFAERDQNEEGEMNEEEYEEEHGEEDRGQDEEEEEDEEDDGEEEGDEEEESPEEDLRNQKAK